MEGLKHLNLDDVDKNICNSIVCFQNEIFRFGLECHDEYESSGNGLFAADGVDRQQTSSPQPLQKIGELKKQIQAQPTCKKRPVVWGRSFLHCIEMVQG